MKPTIFGRVVRAERQLKKMTLPELAKRAKISKGLLSHIENGHGNPSFLTINNLSAALETTFHI
jgi:transcriptional regulator with XRE-family HTH domain